MTILVAFGALIVTYAIRDPDRVYSAVRRYSAADYATALRLHRPVRRRSCLPWSS